MEVPLAPEVSRRLLAWFDRVRRDLPWRRTRDPYRILVAEFLLQRTRVASGTAYYERFLARFPTVRSLAEASDGEVLRAWEGLGFYRRSRHLHAAAQTILERHAGRVPREASALVALPGVGRYTAGAVASIAFGARVPAVDGNAGRVLARLFRVADRIDRGRGHHAIWRHAASLVPEDRPGDFNQALMELGATVCKPLAPLCGICPLEELCLARRAGIVSSIPRRMPKKRAATVRVVFGLVEDGNRLLLVQRPEDGLLADLWSLPGGELRRREIGHEALRRLIRDQSGVEVEVGDQLGGITHAFSHRRWVGSVYACRVERPSDLSPRSRWVDPHGAEALPLVSFQRGILRGLHRSSGPTLSSLGSRPPRQLRPGHAVD